MRNTNFEGLTPGPSLIDRAYQAILGAICGGLLEPGERINQDELAAKLQISRQPVGQALTILKSQGFVRDNGRRGLIVAPLERQFFRSIYQLREALDAMAARLAAGRRSAADITDGQKLLAAGRKAVRSGAMDALIEADIQFHMWIYRVAGNPLLVDTMVLYWNHLRRAMGEILRQPSSRAMVWDEHEAILMAILERNAETAENLAHAHARDASARIADSIPLPASGRPGKPVVASVTVAEPARRSAGREDTPLSNLIASRKRSG